MLTSNPCNTLSIHHECHSVQERMLLSLSQLSIDVSYLHLMHRCHTTATGTRTLAAEGTPHYPVISRLARTCPPTVIGMKYRIVHALDPNSLLKKK